MKNLLIAGGGLVGSLAALMMEKRGYKITLLEKRSDLRKNKTLAGRSINLVVTSRGLNALKKVGLIDRALALTVPVTGRMIHSRTGELNFQAYGRDPSECNYSISRLELNRFLIEECERAGIEIVFEAEVTSVNLETKKLSFRTGSNSSQEKSINYDVLLGTDGAGSVLRSSLSKSLPGKFQEHTEFLNSDYKELFLPVRTDGRPALEKNALHIWPRGSHMLMALPNLDGSFTMTLYLPKMGGDHSFSKLDTIATVKSFLQSEFPDAFALMPRASEEFLQNPQGNLGTVRATPWIYQDSVAILGDAAHAIVPFFGQGMNLGFEDCVYLDYFLDQADEDWKTALENFDKFQRPNANAIADMALENFVEMRDLAGDSQFQLKKKIEARIEKEMPKDYRSRYGMITYTLIPYALAQEAGRIQEKILQELSHGIKSDQDLNLAKAKELVKSKFSPFVHKHNLNLEKFKI